jgi:hypothetical protein
MKKLNLTLLIITMVVVVSAQTRGTLEGEIYYPTSTYMDNQGQVHTAIFRSTDHGAHLQLQYETLTEPPAGDMPIGQVVGDATPGVLYNYGANELWVSFDYGVSWEYRENIGTTPRYTSGCLPNEIYRCCSNSEGTVWRSINFGENFLEIREGIKFTLEVGIEEGELFGIYRHDYPSDTFYIAYSNDYGTTFSEFSIDSSIAYWSIGGYYPKITRGKISGELYLVSWWPDYHYKIFHSIDNGLSWTQQYESDAIDLYFWGVSFTAGRQPGSFYVFRNYLEHNGTHRELYIDYSNDYGQTFTTFHHTLDSTVSIAEPAQEFQIRTYPNPFNDQLTIELPRNISLSNDYKLNIYNTQGRLVTTKSVHDYNITWQPHNLPEGIYYIKLQTEKKTYTVQKVLFMN